MPYHTIPRNYFDQEYPLPHEFDYRINLAGEDQAKNSTICTLLQSKSVLDVSPDAVEVNPRHANFAEETGPTCQIGSIVERMMVSINAFIPINAKKGSGVDDIDYLNFNWMPIYNSFVEGLDSINEEDGADIESILELQHDVTKKSVTPLFVGGSDLILAGGQLTHPMGTINNADAFGDWDLGTTTNMESVAFDSNAFFDTLKYGTNSGMLKKMIGRWNKITVKKDHPYKFFSNNFVHPMVKRMNPFTYCGILFHLPQASSTEQLFDTGDTTLTIAQLHVNVKVSFPEWNSQFDQTAI